jgi:hypothetical protein
MKASRNRMKSNARSTWREQTFAALDQMDPSLTSERLGAYAGCSAHTVVQWRIRKSVANLLRMCAELQMATPKAANSVVWVMLVMSDFDVSGF